MPPVPTFPVDHAAARATLRVITTPLHIRPRVMSMKHPPTFRTMVHGTVFGHRSTHLDELAAGDRLLLIPDPPGEDDPAVWVHLPEGDPVGHLPPEINAWLAPLMMRGGTASATTLRVGGSEVPSWKRLLIEVNCADATD